MKSHIEFEGISLETDHPIAIDSLDHINPYGTARDNSTNLAFNEKLKNLFHCEGVGLSILDLGCSGGGFVQSCLDQGSLAVGLEGSNYSLKFQRAQWPFLANKFLFTADITKPFQVYVKTKGGKESLVFDIITMWEVLEHIKESDLPILLENVIKHLSSKGLFIVSISPNDSFENGVNLHQTVHDRSWWENLFHAHGLFVMKKYEDFFGEDYVRGPWEGSFNLILSKNPELAPEAPARKEISFKNRMRKRWKKSRLYHSLMKWLLPDI